MILITGASGFIGRNLSTHLVNKGGKVRVAVRKDGLQNVETHTISDMASPIDWIPMLDGVETIYHLAARVHVMRENMADSITAFRQVNVHATAKLAQAAAQQGVKRFVYVSSLHVNGEVSPIDRPFTEQSQPHPQSPYAISKWEAEQALWQMEGLEIVIVRPPLVYGANVKANFERLIKLARWPLPFKSVENRRSLVGVNNLVDFLHICGTHPAAAGELFLISDGEDVSTPELIRRIAQHQKIFPKLFPFPPQAMQHMAKIMKQEKLARSLLGSLVVDSSKARLKLGWSPPLSLDEELARCFPDHPA